MDISTSTSTVSTIDGAMELYEAKPDGEARGAIVVVQEAFGVNDHIQDVTRRFAEAGYHAVAPAFFHRAGGGTAPTKSVQTSPAVFPIRTRVLAPTRRFRTSGVGVRRT